MAARKTGILSIDGTDIGSLGFGVSDLGDFWGSIGISRESVSVYGTEEALPAPDGIVEPVSVSLGLVWLGVVADRQGALDDLSRLLPLKKRCAFSIGDGRVAYGYRDGPLAFGLAGHWRNGAVIGRPQITFYDPAKYDDTATVLSLSSTPTTMNLGTRPSHWVWAFSGKSPSVVNPALVVQDYDTLEELYRLELSCSAGTGEDWEVDSREHLVTADGSSEPSAVDEETGYFLPIGGEGLSRVKISMTAESGTPTGTLTYPRTWE